MQLGLSSVVEQQITSYTIYSSMFFVGLYLVIETSKEHGILDQSTYHYNYLNDSVI